MRLIDADALMDYCNNLKGKTIDANDIARFPTAVGWISVKDRLPEEQKIMIATLAYQHSSNYVLIYLDGITWPYNRKLITIGRYDYDESRWVVRNAFRGEVTHWMPLPEPPEEAE